MNPGPSRTELGARKIRPVRRRRTFEQLRTSPHRGRRGPVAVSYVEQNTWSTPEVAYAIGRRTGTAVARNRLRRRLRAILAEAAPTLPAGAYLIRTAPEAAGVGFDHLQAAVVTALDRALPGGRASRPSPRARSGWSNGPGELAEPAGSVGSASVVGNPR